MRKENKVLIAFLLSAFLLNIAIPPLVRSTTASTLVVPDDYLTIQGAVDAASPGATIFVRSGDYQEHVSVNKSLDLIGEGRDTTIIDGGNTGTILSVDSNDVSLSGFKIQNGETGLVIEGKGSIVTSNAFSRTGIKTTESKANLEVFSEPPVSPVWRYLYDLIGARFTEVFQLTTKASAIKVKISGRDGVAQLSLGLFYDANNDGVPQFQEFTGYASRDKETDVSLADPPVGQFIIKVQGYDVTGNPGHFDREITTYQGYGLIVRSSSNCTIRQNTFTDNFVGLSVQSSSEIDVHDNNVTRNVEGIIVGEITDSVLSNNTISETFLGEVYGAGLSVRSSRNVSVIDNSVSSKAFGINFWNSSGSSASGNSLDSNGGWGIDLHSSRGNSLSANRISRSKGLDGIRLMFSSDNLLSRNGISYSEHSGILLWYDCYNNLVLDNNIQRSGYQGWGHGHGVEVLFSSRNLFANNSIFNNNHGIIVIEAPNNVFTENLIYSNPLGMQIRYTIGNEVYHNNFLDNCQWQALDETGGNLWDNGYPSGGNYWSEYGGPDQFSGPFQNVTGNDGIFDQAYRIEASEEDAYPLTRPYTSAPRLGDINGDRLVDIIDLVIVAAAFNSIPGDWNWNQVADINSDQTVDIFDVVIVAVHFGESN